MKNSIILKSFKYRVYLYFQIFIMVDTIVMKNIWIWFFFTTFRDTAFSGYLSTKNRNFNFPKFEVLSDLPRYILDSPVFFSFNNMYLFFSRKLTWRCDLIPRGCDLIYLKRCNTVVRTNKGRTNKGQITFFRKIYCDLIRDKYF